MNDERDQRDGDGRSRAEWVVFTAAAVVLGVVLTLVAWQWIARNDPADVSVEVAGIERRNDAFLVSVDVHNDGDRAATDVGVSAELDIDGDVTAADDSIEFLAGGRTETIEFLFPADPAAGELDVRITSFRSS